MNMNKFWKLKYHQLQNKEQNNGSDKGKGKAVTLQA